MTTTVIRNFGKNKHDARLCILSHRHSHGHDYLALIRQPGGACWYFLPPTVLLQDSSITYRTAAPSQASQEGRIANIELQLAWLGILELESAVKVKLIVG
jgi:hypothetical protein